MLSKVSKKIVLITVFMALALILFFSLKLIPHGIKIFAGNKFLDGYSLLDPAATEKSDFGIPVYIRIPKIHVSASFESIGINSDGEMGVPESPSNVGWFNLGPRPGEIGSAVISGHYGWKNGIPAVFDDLNKLSKGDRIYVEDDKGNISSFVVSRVRSYDPDADATEVFNMNDAKAHLNLITCEGIWNADLKSYSKRLVVFTDKE